MKNIAIMGATGSIGDSNRFIISANPARYQVIGLTGFSRLISVNPVPKILAKLCVCPPIKRRKRLTNFKQHALIPNFGVKMG